jgi:hypothetical protein
MAAAVAAAAPFLQLFRGGNPAQVKRPGEAFLHMILQIAYFLLGVQKPLGHRIAQKGVALGIEGGDFAAIQGKALMLAFVEGAALLGQALILALRAGVGQERFDALADVLKLGLSDNGIAQFQSFLAHRFLDENMSFHKLT